jgi:hypothetical protein
MKKEHRVTQEDESLERRFHRSTGLVVVQQPSTKKTARQDHGSSTERRVSFSSSLTRNVLYDDEGEAIEVVSAPPDKTVLHQGENKIPDVISKPSERATTTTVDLTATASTETTNSTESSNQHHPSTVSPARPTMIRRDAQSELITSDKIYQGPTPLHHLCHSAKTVDPFMLHLQTHGRDATAACRKDSQGRLPLHLMADNHALAAFLYTNPTVEDTENKTLSLDNQDSIQKLTKFMVQALLSPNPTGISWRDDDDYIPFQRALVEWTRRIHSFPSDNSRSKRSLLSASSQRPWSVSNAFSYWASLTTTDLDTMEQGTTVAVMNHYNAEGAFPTAVRLTALVRLAIHMLSYILEQLNSHKQHDVRNMATSWEDNTQFQSFCHSDAAQDFEKYIVETVASIPQFVFTIFLLEDASERDWALQSTLLKRVARHAKSVGPWITAMLRKHKTAQRGLQYLDIVSCSDSLFLETITQLDGFIPSLLALEERLMEEAATTFVVRSVLDKMISKPFAVSVVFFDFLFLCVLMVGFRYTVNEFLLGKPAAVVLPWIYVANTGIFYFIIRELGKGITLVSLTRQASVYLWSFWNITDILCTFFALASTMTIRLLFSKTVDYDAIDGLRSVLAVTTGLLWLRALSLLKSLNIQLATFVLAILQISKDIFWFLIILFVLVASFSQMFYTVLVPSSCAVNNGSAKSEECSQAEYYLRVYAILAGMGDFANFDRSIIESFFPIFLVVIFSFMVVIVLLNVLIAIISDSYEKCLVRSHYLFGRARVLLIAELVSFQNLLGTHSGKKGEDGSSERCWSKYFWNPAWSRASTSFFLLSTLVTLVWLVGECVGFFSGGRQGLLILRLLSVLVNVMLFVGIIAFLSRGAKVAGSVTREDGDTNDAPKSSKWYGYFQRAMLHLLGTTQETESSSRNGDTDEWRGRLNYLQKEMERIATDNKFYMVDQMKQHVALSESCVRSEMSNLEVDLSDLKLEIMGELRDMERRTLDNFKSLLESALSSSSRSSGVGIARFIPR